MYGDQFREFVCGYWDLIASPDQRGRQTAYMWHHQILLQKLIHWGSTKNTIENQQEC